MNDNNRPIYPFPSILSPTLGKSAWRLVQAPRSESSAQQNSRRQQTSDEKTSGKLDVASTKKSFGCNCRNSRCIKLYCECFASQKRCGSLCKCQSCQNGPHAPDARKAKPAKGCTCKKSECQKKYCECFNSGKKCSEDCLCENCKNHNKLENEGSVTAYTTPVAEGRPIKKVKSELQSQSSNTTTSEVREIVAVCEQENGKKLDTLLSTIAPDHEEAVIGFLVLLLQQ